MKMLQGLRFAQNLQNQAVIHRAFAVPGGRSFRGGGRTVRLAQASDRSDPDMDTEKEAMTNNPSEQTRDVMSHSFGEGYATRSDEEGFGGIYGGNDSECIEDDQGTKIINESHPDYDREQGSEVKETEKGRNSKGGDFQQV